MTEISKAFSEDSCSAQPDRPVRKSLHLAIIMDGNGRWATRRGLPRVAGHGAGVESVKRLVERAPDVGIRWLTLYAFSSDNWRRPPAEVEGIFWLLRTYLRLETKRLRDHEVRLEFIGRRDRLPELLSREMAVAERETAVGQRLHLRIAIDYSSRDAIARAASMVRTFSPEHIASRGSAEEFIRDKLDAQLSCGSGDVDLLIRTGGEKRLSDFLLWELAYTELLFTDRMWPDFDASDLDAALQEFRGRERRFGGLPTELGLVAERARERFGESAPGPG